MIEYIKNEKSLYTSKQAHIFKRWFWSHDPILWNEVKDLGHTGT